MLQWLLLQTNNVKLMLSKEEVKETSPQVKATTRQA
jgi:hypothetical protein